jgi:hypothetical protein
LTKKQCIAQVCELIELVKAGIVSPETAKSLAESAINSYAFNTVVNIANLAADGNLFPVDITKVDIAKPA